MNYVSKNAKAVRMSDQRVMLVDDNVGIRRLVKSLLFALGARDIVECSDGSEAFDNLLTRPADLILTAWDMEPTSGIELTSALRREADSPCPEANIIMVSGRTQKEEVLAARDAGITEFLAKPISVKSLYTRVMSVLQYPRPFIRCSVYIGPCRRRKFPGGYGEFEGEDRREEDSFVID